MKEEELRIGSCVNYKGQIVYLEASDFAEFDKNLLDLIKPVSITEKWMNIYGFRKYKNPNNTGGWIHRLSDEFALARSFAGRTYHLLDCTYSSEIKYMHQLQGIYFELRQSKLLSVKERYMATI